MSTNKLAIGRRNLKIIYLFTAASRLWFDGGLWFIFWQSRGVSIFEVGLLEAILHVVCLISDVPLGIFADRFGWKVTLLTSSLCGMVYTLLALFSHSFWPAAVAFVFRGLQVTMTSGSDAAIAYESAQWAEMEHQYLTISGRIFAVALVSMGLAEAVSGELAEWSWTILYVAYTAANAVSFVVTLWIQEPRATVGTTQRQSVFVVTRDALRYAKSHRSFSKWVVLSGTLSGVLATFAFYGQSLLNGAGWTLAAIGLLGGVQNGLGALTSALAARIASRFGERKTIAFVAALASLGLLMLSWLSGLFTGLGFLVSSLALSLADPLIDQGLNRVVPTSQRATLLSFNSTAFSVFMIVIFPLYGVLIQHVGLHRAALMGSVGGVGAILGAACWWGRGHQTS